MKKKNFISPIKVADSPPDEEVWAIMDCNTSTHAQDIMDKRIERVCLEIQSEWTGAERERRALHIARVPWSVPSGVKPAGPGYTKRRERVNGENEPR